MIELLEKQPQVWSRS